VIAGAVAAFSGASPTGGATVDLVLVGATVAGATWLGAGALRWDGALLALVAALTSATVAGATVGLSTAIVGYTWPIAPRHRNVVTALMVGIALNIAARSQLGGFLGSSSIVFFALAAYISAVGIRRRSRTVRLSALVVAAVAAGVAVVGTAMFALFGYRSIDDIRDADDHARRGLDALGDGDIDAARDAFTAATISFERADDRIDSPLTAVARVVPGVAQHHRLATGLTAAGADSTRLLAARLGDVELDALTLEPGRIDVDAVRSLQEPLRAIDVQIRTLQQTIAGLDSQWLIPVAAERVDDLTAEFAEQRERSFDALTVATAAPDLLGADGPRTYFIGFTTPVEARGLGGFMGNWAEITVTDGRIEMTAFGRADDLNDAGDDSRRFTTSDRVAAGDDDPRLDEWLARYGAYNLTSGPDGTTDLAVWKNINMSPDMATTGRAVADLYPQSGGSELDGVFMMDVYTLARLLQFTGPIELPDGQVVDGRRTVTADTAADFLLKGQYDITSYDERIDVLEEFSHRVIEQLLSGPLPAPVDLLDALGPMAEQGRLAGWAARASEQDLLTEFGLGGTLLEPVGDAVAIAFNNAAGSKIDYYLTAEADYTVTADGATNTATADLDVSLTNAAPSSGEPEYVISNLIGLPDGYNRTWVSIFSKLPVTEVRLDGEPVAVEVGTEAGYFVTSVFVTLGPGETRSLALTMDGRLDVADGYELAVRTPPGVAPTPVRIDATWTGADGHTERSTSDSSDPGLTRVRLDAAE
jgi:hypothetical protein